jgi:bifunctional N-acetylglucosamine-1-phosphate-uridyltransferase/glucosamine-1-phosphate-acetyltransferase GlmU-like protein
MHEKLGAIILAAGQGKRMESKDVNKVTLPLGGKPMILHTAELLKTIAVSPIVIVVGFAKESVKGLFNGDVLFAEQKQRLGTAHAVQVALNELPDSVEDVLILQGDDSAFYGQEIIKNLLSIHRENAADFTFLTIDVDNPTGLGRILRSSQGGLLGIVEEKDANEKQKKINEINPACYVANVRFLKKYLPYVKKSLVTGEYYLTSLIDIGIKNNEKIQTLRAGKIIWRGINTKQELEEAEKLLNLK